MNSYLVSVLFFNLSMFDLCLIKINATKIKTPITNHKLSGQRFEVGIDVRFNNNSCLIKLVTSPEIKTLDAPSREPNETNLVINQVNIKTNIPTKQILGEYPKAAPAPVDTAFPPLNFKKIGNI